MITLLISDTTFSYIIFDFLEDILDSFTKVLNLGRLISEKNIRIKTEKLPKNSHRQFYDN